MPLLRTTCPNFGHLSVKLKSKFLHGKHNIAIILNGLPVLIQFQLTLCPRRNSRIPYLGHVSELRAHYPVLNKNIKCARSLYRFCSEINILNYRRVSTIKLLIMRYWKTKHILFISWFCFHIIFVRQTFKLFYSAFFLLKHYKQDLFSYSWEIRQSVYIPLNISFI